MQQTKPSKPVLTPSQIKEIIDAINDVIAQTGFGEVIVEIGKFDVDIIKAIYRKPRLSRAKGE